VTDSGFRPLAGITVFRTWLEIGCDEECTI